MKRIYKSGRSEPLSYAVSNIAAEGDVFEITRILPMEDGMEFIWEYSVK
jgi:hypothetical protein